MANTLGTIVVDLQANTAAFVEGMTRASSAAKHAGGEIHESFSRLGEIAGSMLAPFGEIGHVIGEAFGQIGVLGASASSSLAKMSGGMSFLAVGGGLAVGAIAALEAAAIGLTIHTAEAAAKMLIMSQVTGVSVETLSGMAFVAKQSGVEAETMQNGLTKLNKAIFAAAVAAPGATNAFSRLHIAVRDSNGEIRGTEDVFRDVAEKFSKMEDGPVKGALAIQLFGKAGAGLIPILNQGKAGIDEFLETARALGIVLDTETAEAAHKFEQGLNTLQAAGQGLEIHLMRELLPALDTVVKMLIEGFKDKRSGLNEFIDGVVWLTKATIALGDTFLTAFGSIGRGVANAIAQFAEFGKGIWAIGTSSSPSELIAAFTNTRARMKAIDDQFIADNTKAWAKNDDLIKKVMGPAVTRIDESTFGKHGGSTDVAAKAPKEDTILKRIQERIEALWREADQWLKMGEAGTRAEQLLAEAVKKGDAEISKMRVDATHEKDPARRDEALKFVEQNKGFIETKAAASVFGAAIENVVAELDKQIQKTEEETSATEALEAAWGTAGVTAALINQHFAAQTADVNYLRDAHDLLAATFGEEDARTRQMADGYAIASGKLDVDKVKYAAKMHEGLSFEITKAEKAFANELPILEAISDAYFQTAKAARDAQIAQRVDQYKTTHPDAGEDEIRRVTELEQKKSDQAFRSSIAEQASKFDLIHAYDEEIHRLDLVREKLQEQGRSTLFVDAAIYDEQERLIRQWDEAALKVGTYGQKFRAVMNQVVLDGKDFAGKLFQAIGKTIDDLSTNLAKLVVTGKANFKQMFEGLAESVAKAGFQKLFSVVLGKLGFGGLAKADGSASNPFYVKFADDAGGIFGSKGKGFGGLFGGGEEGDDGSGEGGGGIFGGLKDIFSKITGAFGGIFSKLGSIIGSIAGGVGRAFSSIFSFFGGFLASGGDVTPGKAYIVGEKHPEFFVPKQAGQVTPSLKMGGTTQHTSIVQMHIHGVTDFDSFKRSQGQIMAHMQRQLATAHARNA